jgi:hypothetical protein
MEPNSEQRDIVRASRTSRTMVVDALAGTGKTSTLELVGGANPYTQFLYVAFNRAVKDEAEARFPGNVRCKTSHGMVFMQYGKRYGHRLNAPRVPSRRAASILGLRDVRAEFCVSCNEATQDGYTWAAAEVDAGRGSDWHLSTDAEQPKSHQGHAVMAETLEPVTVANLVMRTVDRFCHSADRKMTTWHVPFAKGVDPRLMPAIRQAVLPHAQDAWTDMLQANGQLRFSHDVYLKMAQLDGWRCKEGTVLLDEAQDTNPCLSSMFKNMTGKRLFLVGDPNQAIYEWRGAKDAMEEFETETRLSLTGSYRFGPAIAEEANLWLGMLGTDLRLRGWKKRDSHVVERIEDPDAILTRSNAGAIVETMEQLERGKKVAIVGGGKDIEALARAAQDLQAGRKSDHPELVVFESWTDVQRYCKEEPEDAGTLVPLVRAIDSHGPQAIMAMTRQLVDESNADVTVSTAHKAKGRQWGKVRIGGDFPPPKEGEPQEKEELRLAYVAVTRAMFELDKGSLDYATGVAA